MSRSPEVSLGALEGDERVLWHTDVLRFGDTDKNGHVNNAAFAVFCESGRVNYLDRVMRPLRTSGELFVIAKLTIEFRAELFVPGQVRSGTWVGELGRTSVTFRQGLFDDAGRLVATSEAVTVAVNGETRRPEPHGPELLAVLREKLRLG